VTECDRIKAVNELSHYDICRIWRFAETGHPLMQDLPGHRLAERLQEFGGFTPQISKSLGWSRDTVLTGEEYR
jgi:hypothetical protein